MWNVHVRLTLLCLITFIAVVIQAQKVYIPFDCRRLNSPCVATLGGQCQSTGSCQCTNAAQESYNCGLRSAQKVAVNCQVPCDSNRGQCYNDGTGHKCYCEPSFYGPSCNQNRVAIPSCSDTTLSVVINPHQTGVFNGKIYVQGLENEPDCQINIAATSPYQGLTKVLSLSINPAINRCASKLITTTVSGDRVNRYNIMVQYDQGMINPTDEVHIFQCTHTSTGQTIGLVLGNVGFDDVAAASLSGQTVNVGYFPIGMTVTTRPNRGVLAGNIVRVGTELFIEVSLLTQTTFVAIRVTTVTAFDSDIITGATRRKELVVNSCPAADSTGIVRPPLRRLGTTTFSMSFDMFKFVGSNTVFFTASAVLCSQADVNNCSPVNCNDPVGGASSGFGRKKRQTTDDNVAEVSRRVFVITADDDTVETCRDKEMKTTKEESCFESVAFIAVAAIFGLILLVLVMVLILVACFRSRKSKKTNFNDQDDDFKSYTNPVTKM